MKKITIINGMLLGYFLIPLTTVITALVGATFTSYGMTWYLGLNIPSWTPPGKFIGIAWTVIYVLTTISALIVWSKQKKIMLLLCLFLLNAFLNVTWTFLFFQHNLLGSSTLESILLLGSVFLLIIMIWPVSKTASIILVPYFIWVSIATYLSFLIFRLN